MRLLPGSARGPKAAHDLGSASAGKPQTPGGSLGSAQLQHLMLTPNLASNKGVAGQHQTLTANNSLFEQPQRSDSSAMKLQENPTVHPTSQTSSNH